MKSALLIFAATPLFATAAFAANPQDEKQENPTEASEEAKAETVEDNKRICRYVRTDASSRRKTKICRTKEQWRELNNPR